MNKLERFKVLVTKKIQIPKETTDKVKKLREVEEDQNKDIERKDKEIAQQHELSTKEKKKSLKKTQVHYRAVMVR